MVSQKEEGLAGGCRRTETRRAKHPRALNSKVHLRAKSAASTVFQPTRAGTGDSLGPMKIFALVGAVIAGGLFCACGGGGDAAQPPATPAQQQPPPQQYGAQPQQYPAQQPAYGQAGPAPQQQYPQQQGAPPPTGGAAAPTGGQMATPGQLALPCQNDSACGFARCNVQFQKCAFPCQNSALDCAPGNGCNTTTGLCLPGQP
jgi:hypothetical protein